MTEHMSENKYPALDTVSALLILVTVFHVLAVILTSFRLWFRYHIRRLWWDDFWAFLALLGDAICMVVAWTLTAPLDDPLTSFQSLPILAEPRSVHIISYWLGILCYTCSIWFARLSIVCSLVRIVPPDRSIRRTAFGAGVLFALMGAYMLVSKSVPCATDTSWYHFVAIQCPLSNWVAVSEVCTDIVSDVILVVLPFRLLWRVRLPSDERIMVLSVFSTSILVSVVSAVHTAYLIPFATFIGGATAEMESAVSLIVCNLLVLVTFIYRVFKNGRDLTANVSDKSSDRLTTVDLDLSGGSLFTRQTCGTCTNTNTTVTETQFTSTDVSSVKFVGGSDGETIVGAIVATDRLRAVPPAMTPGCPSPITH